MANLSYIQSQEPLFIGLQTSLQAKAEAYESAADCLLDKFPNEITRVETMRFNDIHQHHMEEVEGKRKSNV
jgi:hypothetical protein